jgi:hypothetical protein
MTGLAIATVLIGLFPGAILSLAAPTLRLLAEVSMASRAGVLTVSAQSDAPGYLALAVALLLGIATAAAAALLQGTEGVAAWECGAEPPPPWLPFGDPLTQYGGASMAQPLRRTLGAGDFFPTRPLARFSEIVSGFAERLSVPTVRQGLTAIALITLLALVLVAIAEQS